MPISWFDAREAEAFGLTLAKYFSERIPPKSIDGSRKHAARRQEAMKGMLQLRDHFRANHKLNFYKKAKLANTFKWALREAGYDAAVVDQLTMDVVLKL